MAKLTRILSSYASLPGKALDCSWTFERPGNASRREADSVASKKMIPSEIDEVKYYACQRRIETVTKTC